MEKLIKSFESLKSQLQNDDLETNRKPELKQAQKKEKINHLNIVYEQIISVNIRQNAEYVKFLSHAIEIFLLYFDDEEKDISFVAEECLNKTIKALLETNLGRLQVELCRFIKKNGSEKCLKAALTRFAELSHLIRPQKCRHFAEFLLKEGTMKKISSRQEESIQNILIDVMTKLCCSLCCCMTENEIKILLDSFLPNLSNDSPVNIYRRVSASCLSIICLYSRRPSNSFRILFNELIKLISDDKCNKFTIWGVLICFRNILVNIGETERSNLLVDYNDANKLNLLNICEIYKICMNYLDYNDSSVVGASLECLQVLTKFLPLQFRDVFTKPHNLNSKIIINEEAYFDSNDTSENKIQNLPVVNFTRILAQKYLLDGKSQHLKSDKEAKVFIKAIALECITNIVTVMPDVICLPLANSKKHTEDSEVQYLWDIILYINHSDDKMKSHIFLLIGTIINTVLLQSNGNYEKWLQKSSNKCVIPESLHLKHLVQSLSNVLKHDASNMCKRSVISSLCICLPSLINSNYSTIALKLLIQILELKHSTYNLVKLELVQLLSSINFRALYFAEQILSSRNNNNNNNDTTTINSTATISTIDIQNRIIKDIFISLLGSDDSKLRIETARRCTNLIENLYFYETSEQNILLGEANYIKRNLSLLIGSTQEISHPNFQFLFSILKLNSYSATYVQPFKNLLQNPNITPNASIESNLNFFIPILIEMLINCNEKHRFIGAIETLDFIFQIYEPSLYLSHTCLVDLLNLLVSYLQHPFVAFDLYTHEILLRIIGSLFCAAIWKFIIKLDPNTINLEQINTSQPWYLLLNNSFLINIADSLFTHLMHLLCLIASVIDDNVVPANSLSNLNSNSTVNPANLITSTLSGVVSAKPGQSSVNNLTNINTSSSSNARFKLPNNENLDDQSSQSQSAKLNNSFIGSFQSNSIYMKLYDSVKLAFNSYKKSIHIGVNDKFFKFIRSILKIFSQLMECALSTIETSKFLEETLIYLKVIFSIDPANIVKCVTQMLKSLFGMNFLNTYFNSLVDCVSGNVSGNNQKIDMMTTFITMVHYRDTTSRKTGLFSSLVKNISEDFNSFIQNQSVLFKNDQRISGSPTSILSQDTLSYYDNNDKNEQNRHSEFNNQSLHSTQSTNSSSNSISSRFSLNPLSLVNFIRKKPNESQQKNLQRQKQLDSKLISQYIRSFESIVIISLRQYTTTSYVNLQVRVLELLIQLICLKVNYSLLDSDKVFIDYILKQFDFLEQKHCSEEAILTSTNESVNHLDIDSIEIDSISSSFDIDSNLSKLYYTCCNHQSANYFNNVCLLHKQNQHKNFHILIPKVFEFLILLSYERIDSKQLIGIPNIIQLCDNLLASENSPHTHAIPALRPLVYELFINTKLKLENNKELELQRDVLVIALQRLICYPQIWQLLSIAASKYKKENNEDKWKKLSRQICDIIFQNLKLEQLKFHEYTGTEFQISKRHSRMHNPYMQSLKNLIVLFNSLSPNVYRPMYFVIKSFIETVNIKEFKNNEYSRNNWLSSCIAHVYLLINYSNEELILTRLHDLLTDQFDEQGNIFSFNQDTNIDIELMNSASYIITLLIKVIYLSLTYVSEEIQYYSYDYLKRSFIPSVSISFQDSFTNSFKNLYCSLNLLYNYILFLIHILKSGYYKRISESLNAHIQRLFNLDEKQQLDEDDQIGFYLLNINKIMLNNISKNYPLLALLWQYFLLICNHHDSICWSLSDESSNLQEKDNSFENENENESSSSSSSSNLDLSLQERLFKRVSLLVYCEYTTNNNLLDNSKNLTYLIMNNLIDLFELNNESCVLDVISMIHRNPSASSLFIHRIDSKWTSINASKKLHILYACLKSLEGIHLTVSGHLLKFLVDKYFRLPFLSLVRYADFIACQRLEMIQSLPFDEVKDQFDEHNLINLINFFKVFKYSHRHKRFISLLNHLNNSLLNIGGDDGISNRTETKEEETELKEKILVSSTIDKNAYIEALKNICCHSKSGTTNGRALLKPKQCAKMLSNLDYNSLMSILTLKNFKLSILKECIILGSIKYHQASNIDKSETLWMASKNTLFEILSNLCSTLPHFQVFQIPHHVQNKQIIDNNIYISKLNEVLELYDLYSYILPLIEAINTYLDCIVSFEKQQNLSSDSDSQSNDIVTFFIFSLNLVSYVSLIKYKVLTMHFVHQVLISIYNLLSNLNLKNALIKRNNYPAILSSVIINFYDILVAYFFKIGDENFIYSAKSNIQYKTQYSNELVFSPYVFDTVLKLRFIITNHLPNYQKFDKDTNHQRETSSNLFVHKSPNRFIHYDSKYFRMKIPINIRNLIDKTFLSFCHLPVLDRFLRISDALWYYDFKLEYSQLMNNDLVLPAIEYLKDPHILKEHIKHCLYVGWNTRTQFEYEYVNMLTLLHSLCTEEKENETIKMAIEEIKERNRCACLVFKALSSWLIKATLSPISGCSINSSYEFLSRNRPPLFVTHSTMGENFIEMKKNVENFSRNRLFSINNSPNNLASNTNENLSKFIDSPLFDLVTENNENSVSMEITKVLSEELNAQDTENNLNKKNQYLFAKNLERPMINDLIPISDSFYYFSQISLEGLMKFLNDQQVKNVNYSYSGNAIKSSQSGQIIRSFNENKLDLASVLRTILDHYESFWKTQTLQIKADILKSMIYIANSLFDSSQQYELLLTKLEGEFDLNEFFNNDSNNLANINSSVDLIDDATISIVLYGQSICKCCLQSVQEVKNKDLENINKLIENSLKNNSSAIKIASIHGLFYWLQSLSSGYLNSTIDSKIITEHLNKQMNLLKDFTIYTTSNARYISTLWSAIFFTLENTVDSIKDAQTFVSTFIKITLDILVDPTTPYFLFYQLYLGVERLLLTNTIPSSEINSIQKLLNYKFQDEQRIMCFNILQVASLYSTNQSKNNNYWTDIKSSYSNPSLSTSSTMQFSYHSEINSNYPQILELNTKPELQAALLKVLEVATTFFDKMKTAVLNDELIVCSHLLPYILCDFLPPHDLLNKLITEFSNSTQLSLPETMAFVLFKCFNLLMRKGLSSQIREWVLLSLSNFVLRPNTIESIWFMNCLLISATKNEWLKSMFPFVLNRNGLFEDVDKKLFFKAVLSFKNELKDETQVNTLVKSFEAVAISNNFYQDLLKFIKTNND